MKKLTVPIMTLLVSTSLDVSGEIDVTLTKLTQLTPEFHLVKPGETLSDILFSPNVKPIYGKKGYLKKVLSKNQHLQNHLGNRIYPGNVIYLFDLTKYLSKGEFENFKNDHPDLRKRFPANNDGQDLIDVPHQKEMTLDKTSKEMMYPNENLETIKSASQSLSFQTNSG